eukprot:TRINITY_DN1228_c0_g2_i1.p1 TRINITY_DN1228_c0_g2~~TRINITY_DN1228_c0_g2_i1.p1  ORF type:complete len:348 (+),score=49.61 TRINITY_DN1228_c0_g2_i1:130-1173(+)
MASAAGQSGKLAKSASALSKAAGPVSRVLGSGDAAVAVLAAPWSAPGGKVYLGAYIVDIILTMTSVTVGLAGMFGFSSLVEVGVIDAERARASFSVLSPLVTMATYMSPLPAVIDSVRKMNAQGLPTLAFQLQAVCNVLSICYGIQIMNFAVLFTNMYGLAFQVMFLCADHYVRYTPDTSWIDFTARASILCLGAVYVMSTLAPLNILGQCIILFNIFLGVAPMRKIPAILRSRDCSALPVGMTSLALANNAVWSLYAVILNDVVVLLPSVLGYVFAVIQVLVIMWCKGTLAFDLGFILVLTDRAAIGARKMTAEKDELELGDTSEKKPFVEAVGEEFTTDVVAPAA